MNLSEDFIEYGYLAVFIRQDSAKIRVFGYGMALGLGTLKIMASTSVVGLLVFALKSSISGYARQPSTILT
jgi:hypothetical protein